jgi:hypothetical protein
MAIIHYRSSGVPYKALSEYPGLTFYVNFYKNGVCEISEFYPQEFYIIKRAYYIVGSQIKARANRECSPKPLFIKLRDYNGYEIVKND